MKNIVIVSQAPLTPQISRNNYIQEYKALGYKVYFWDLSQLIHKGMQFNDELHHEFIRKCNNYKELEFLIQNIDTENHVFIFDFDPTWKNRKIFKIFSQYNAKMLRIDMYGNTSLHQSLFRKIINLISYRPFRKLKIRIQNLLYKFYKKVNHIKDFDKKASSSKYVYRDFAINHPDYDDFMFNESQRPINGNYIVFVDTLFGQHPDDKYIYNYNKKANISKYFSSLNKFFKYLEDLYGIPVIIAAHPKAAYNGAEFENRTIIKYKTKDLIKYADSVILQICNTMSWICLANKPVMLITCDEYDHFSNYHTLFKTFASAVNLPIYNVDSFDYGLTKFQNIDSDLRRNYIYSYLTFAETEHIANQLIITREIEKI